MLVQIRFYWNAMCHATKEWSRGFWLYLCVLSLPFLVMGVANLRGVEMLEGGRLGPVAARPGNPVGGMIEMIVGIVIAGFCLTNAFRRKH